MSALCQVAANPVEISGIENATPDKCLALYTFNAANRCQGIESLAGLLQLFRGSLRLAKWQLMLQQSIHLSFKRVGCVGTDQMAALDGPIRNPQICGSLDVV